MHRIGPPSAALFDAGSAMERSRAWIEQLHEEGRRSAGRFLSRHGRDVGIRETLDIGKVFVDERSVPVTAAARRERPGEPVPSLVNS